MRKHYVNGIYLGKALAQSIIQESKYKDITYYNATAHFERIIDLKNAVYMEHPFKNGALGLTESDSFGVSITVNSEIDIAQRKNFTIAHEIGHLLLHIETSKVKSINSFLETIDTLTIDSEESGYIREAEANAFAANLLLPDEVLKFQILSNMNAYQIKYISGISIQALHWRIIDYLKDYHSIGKNNSTLISEEFCSNYYNSSVEQTELYRIIKKYPEISPLRKPWETRRFIQDNMLHEGN